jgi:lipoate-protein ligase A
MEIQFENYGTSTGAQNMALDIKMLEDSIEKQDKNAHVRLYSWSPKCITLGRNQKDFIMPDFKIDVVRRPTGGRALLHDTELTYCFVSPVFEGESIVQSYKTISNALILGFEKLGIELEIAQHRGYNTRYCMNSANRADVSYKGRKLIGSAQFRARSYILQHGSILTDADFDLIEKVFGQKVEKNNIITLKEINPEITKEQLIEALEYGFKKNFEH